MTKVLLIGGNAIARMAIQSAMRNEIDLVAESNPGLTSAQVEEKALINCGLIARPYYRASIKDRHVNDDWRGKGNRRKVFK